MANPAGGKETTVPPALTAPKLDPARDGSPDDAGGAAADDAGGSAMPPRFAAAGVDAGGAAGGADAGAPPSIMLTKNGATG